MSDQGRGISTAGASVSRKRLYSTTSSRAAVNDVVSGARPAAAVSNRLLAGYMAYEFLEKGTLFGHRFEAEGGADLKTSRKRQQPSASASASASPNYLEVANLVKSGGVHVAGVVNPTQLARWIDQS